MGQTSEAAKPNRLAILRVARPMPVGRLLKMSLQKAF